MPGRKKEREIGGKGRGENRILNTANRIQNTAWNLELTAIQLLYKFRLTKPRSTPFVLMARRDFLKKNGLARDETKYNVTRSM